MRPEDCIFYQIAKTNQAAMRFFSEKIARLNVTNVQAMVLLFLLDQDRVTAKNLGERVRLDSATLTGVIDRLSALGLAERSPNPDDRRAILVSLTRRGRELAADLARTAARANRDFLRELSADERQTLRELMANLREIEND